MQKKQLETVLFSIGGVAAMFVILVVLNFALGMFKTRVDLTHEKLYTLTDGTKAILKKLDGKVEIRFYVTQSEKEVPPEFKNYAQHVEDLLSEYKQYSKGKITIKKMNPKPDSDEEDSARLDGIEGQMLPTQDMLYLGVAISMEPEKVSIPFLAPSKEKLLEYDISRAISKVMNPQKPVVGIMTPLPMFGQRMNPMMMRMGQQAEEPWVIISELQQDFTVKQLPMDTDKIDDEIKVLIVAHPKDITDKAQYAVDQFVMRGGKLIACLDGMSIMDKGQQQPGMPNMGGGGSSLDKLLKAWGITFDTTKVVADAKFQTRAAGRSGRAEPYPAVLSISGEGINKDEIVTSQIDSLLLPFAGAFSGTPAAGLKETVLLKSTSESQLVEGFLAQMSGEQISKEFKSSGNVQKLAIRLTGKFKTAFPDGKPAEQKDPADKKDEKKDEKKSDDSLKESKTETAVILVGDSDFLYDQFCVQVQNMFGQRVVIPRNGNLNLCQNMVEQMAGDSNLIAVRSRATLSRPFTVIQEMQAKAEGAYREKLKKMDETRVEAEKRINELQAKKDQNQRFIMSPEQQAELEKLKKQFAETKKEEKRLRKELRQEIDSLENRVKWQNILGMPILTAAFGIGLGVYKSKRASAK
jgi:ABC-type uncharacterized transport system involved in gliding motility auxiliary subunit